MEKTRNSTKVSDWETAQVEYQNALEQSRHTANLRRRDMAFVTTVQAAVFTIIGSNLLSLSFPNFMLSLIAFFVLLLGINSERRLSVYLSSYIERAIQIEKEYGLKLLSLGGTKVRNQRLILSNIAIFSLYFTILLIAWIVVWLLNLLS